MPSPIMTTLADTIAQAVEGHRQDKAAANLEWLLAELKLGSAARKSELELTTARLMLKAQADGLIDGKNAETRNAQLAVYLAEQPEIVAAREDMHNDENAIADLEQQIAQARSGARLCGRLFDAHLAALRAQEPGRSVVILTPPEIVEPGAQEEADAEHDVAAKEAEDARAEFDEAHAASPCTNCTLDPTACKLLPADCAKAGGAPLPKVVPAVVSEPAQGIPF